MNSEEHLIQQIENNLYEENESVKITLDELEGENSHQEAEVKLIEDNNTDEIENQPENIDAFENENEIESKLTNSEENSPNEEEISCELAMKYDYTLNADLPFMKRKLISLQEEAQASFGSSNLDLKKKFSKLEIEKMEAEKRKRDAQQAEILDPSNKGKKSFYQNMNDPSTFLNDAKVHKSLVEKDKENFLQSKRNREEEENVEIQKKKSNVNFNEDWSTLMSGSIKKKSLVQREKELFIEECKKKTEELLKKKNSFVKSHVMKLDDFSEPKKEVNRSPEVPIETEVTEQEKKYCVTCSGEIEKTSHFKQLSIKCKHLIHQVRIIYN